MMFVGEPLSKHLRFPAIGLVALSILLSPGCNDSSFVPAKKDVAKLAKSWPAYEPPSVEDPLEAMQNQSASLAPGAMPATNAIESRLTPPVRPVETWGLPETAVDSLGRIGSPAVPALIRAMEHENPERRLQAARVLARIGPAARQAVPKLVEALHDPDSLVQKAAARALGQIGPAAEEAVEPLLRLVEEEAIPSTSSEMP